MNYDPSECQELPSKNHSATARNTRTFNSTADRTWQKKCKKEEAKHEKLNVRAEGTAGTC
jgi:hypothetical protein